MLPFSCSRNTGGTHVTRRSLAIGGRAWLAAALLLMASSTSRAQMDEPPREEGQPVTKETLKSGDEIRKIGPDLYRLGNITIDAAKRQIICPGKVNMREGLIELLACTDYGKMHESVFVLNIKPVHLHVALLLLNLEPGRNPGVRYKEGSPALQRKPGDTVTIFVRWKERAKGTEAARPEQVKTCRADELVFNVQTKKPMEKTSWVFIGSRLVEDRIPVPAKEGEGKEKPAFKTVMKYGADIDGSLITTYYDPIAILENPLLTVNDDIFYIPNRDLLPPEGTPVEFVITAPEKKAEKAETAKE